MDLNKLFEEVLEDEKLSFNQNYIQSKRAKDFIITLGILENEDELGEIDTNFIVDLAKLMEEVSLKFGCKEAPRKFKLEKTMSYYYDFIIDNPKALKCFYDEIEFSMLDILFDDNFLLRKSWWQGWQKEFGKVEDRRQKTFEKYKNKYLNYHIKKECETDWYYYKNR